jgi:hypothetical protein
VLPPLPLGSGGPDEPKTPDAGKSDSVAVVAGTMPNEQIEQSEIPIGLVPTSHP